MCVFVFMVTMMMVVIGGHKQKTLYVENADVAVDIIKKARDNAKIRLNVMER